MKLKKKLKKYTTIVTKVDTANKEIELKYVLFTKPVTLDYLNKLYPSNESSQEIWKGEVLRITK